MDEALIDLLGREALEKWTTPVYVEWAVEQLCNGRDTPSLRILAGLDNEPKEDVVPYFDKALRELGLYRVSHSQALYSYAKLTATKVAEGRLPANNGTVIFLRIFEASKRQGIYSSLANIGEEVSLIKEGLVSPPNGFTDSNEFIRTECRKWLSERASAGHQSPPVEGRGMCRLPAGLPESGAGIRPRPMNARASLGYFRRWIQRLLS